MKVRLKMNNKNNKVMFNNQVKVHQIHKQDKTGNT